MESPKWFSVKEQLPSPLQDVIVCRCDGTVSEGCRSYTGATWLYGFGEGGGGKITHWMPYPPAPSKKEKASTLVTSVWSPEDVRDAATRTGHKMNAKDAKDFLRRNEQAFLEQLSERGNEILEGMLEHEYYMRASAKWQQQTGGQNES